VNYSEIALIPARSGSKGILNKNLQKVGNRTLLQRAIHSALESEVFSQVFVSSDSNQILDHALESNALPLMRSSITAADDALAEHVVSDFLKLSAVQPITSFRLTYLQPTSPFRSSEHIRQAINLADRNDNQSCVSVTRVHQHPAKMGRIQDGIFQAWDLSLSQFTINRQNLATLYIPNGAVYIFPLSLFALRGGFPILGSAAYEMDEISSIDVDSLTDLQIARSLADETIN
jgi:CMP-N-acetylneuraminic acid synthetase